MRRFAFVLALMLLLLAAFGCGGNEPGSSSGPSANTDTGTPASPAPGGNGNGSGNQENITLRFAWWGGQSRHDYTLKMIEMYEKQHPHVKIEPEYAGFDDYWKKLVPQAAANDLPDVIQMSVAYVTEFAERGQLVDLAEYMEQGLLDKSSIPDSYLEIGRHDGKQYQITLGVNALAVIADPQMIEDAGGTVPTEQWTWDDLEELGAKLKAKGKMLTATIDHRNFLNYYLRSKGQSLFSPDGGLGYTDDGLFAEYFTRYKRMYDNGYFLSLDKFAQKKGIPEDDEMVLGNAAFSFSWSNLFVADSALAKRPLDILPPPGPDADQGLYLQSSQGLSVTQNSKHKEEAVKFVNFFINDIEANKIMLGERGVPISSKVQEAIKPLLSPESSKVVDYIARVGEMVTSGNVIDPVGGVEVIKLLNDLAEQIAYNAITPEEAAAKFRKEATAILAKNKS